MGEYLFLTIGLYYGHLPVHVKGCRQAEVAVKVVPDGSLQAITQRYGSFDFSNVAPVEV